MPTKMTPSRTAMTVSVVAAFLASGGLNAGTPLLIASVPVRATDPNAKARRMRIAETAANPSAGGAMGGGVKLAAGSPLAIRRIPRAMSAIAPTTYMYVGTAKMFPDSRRPRRLATVRSASAMRRELDAPRQELRDDGGDRCDAGGHRDRHGHHVVEDQGRRREDRRHRVDVRLRHGVRATARRVRVGDLAIRGRDDEEQQGDRDRDRHGEDEPGRAGGHQHEDDLLGGVGRGADRVGREDGEGLGLGQPFGDVRLVRERLPDEDRLRARPGPRPPACPGPTRRPWR